MNQIAGGPRNKQHFRCTNKRVFLCGLALVISKTPILTANVIKQLILVVLKCVSE
jgi:hypothetical protein